MSDTPTFASLLTQWTSGDPAVRAGVYAHLRTTPAAAEAVEEFVRDELNGALAGRRVIAAGAMVEVYRDEPAVATALAWVLRQDAPSVACDAVPVLRKLVPERTGPLLADFALHAPGAFRALPPEANRRAGGRSGCAVLPLAPLLRGEGGRRARARLRSRRSGPEAG